MYEAPIFGGPVSESGLPTTCERFNCITKFAYATSAGYNPNNLRKVNQDSYILLPNIMGKLGMHFFGVCDGHGSVGPHVSQYIKQEMPHRFMQHLEMCKYFKHGKASSIIELEQFYHQVPTYLHNTFNLIHQELINKHSWPHDATMSGSTCTAVLFDRNVVYCANAGDSRAVLYSTDKKGLRTTPLSIDHKPELLLEAARVKQMGGRID